MSTPFCTINLNSLKQDIKTNTSNILVSEQALSDMNATIVALENSTNSSVVALGVAITGLDLTKLDKGNFYRAQSTAFVEKTITKGNPSDNNPDQLNGEFDELTLTNINGNADGVCLDFSIVGEWTSQEYNKGVVISKYEASSFNGTYTPTTILRGAVQTTSTRFIQPFTLTYFHQDSSSTLESCCGKYIDEDINANKYYKYKIVVVNSSSAYNSDFHLNRTQWSGHPERETGVSSFTAQEFYD